MVVSDEIGDALDRKERHRSMDNNENCCRVLVVDDDKLVREFLKSLLKNLGAEVVAEAENGSDAVRAFVEYNPDLTFLDIQMPVKNGDEALKEILEKDSDANVVMLTGERDMTVADACIEIGARNFIRKHAASNLLRTMVKMQLDAISPHDNEIQN